MGNRRLVVRERNSLQIFQQPAVDNLALIDGVSLYFDGADRRRFFGSNDQDRPRIGCTNYLALWSELTEVRFLRTELHQ